MKRLWNWIIEMTGAALLLVIIIDYLREGEDKF
jgi:hypothetical protein